MRVVSRPILTTLILAGALAAFAPSARAQAAPPADADTLDEQLLLLLGNNCANLEFSGDRQQFGENLFAICDFPVTTSGGSSGGGAASPQASALSVRNSLVGRRLERAKRKGGDGGSASLRGLFRGFLGNAQVEGSVASDDPASTAASRSFDVFASGTYESLDREPSPFEDGFDSSIAGGAVGADYRFSDTVVAGLVAGYRKHEGDFAGGGDFEMTAFEPTVYVSVLPSPKTFLQFVAGYAGQDADVNRFVHLELLEPDIPSTRIIEGFVGSATDANVWSGGAQFGSDHAAGSFTYGPRVGVNYSRTTIDAYSESGTTGLELALDERTVESLQGVAGFYGSVALSSASGIWLPQFGVEYVHEFEDDASVVNARFVEDLRGAFATDFNYLTNSPDSDFFNVDAGVAAVFANGIQPFLNVRAMLGNEHFDNLGVTLGIRFEL